MGYLVVALISILLASLFKYKFKINDLWTCFWVPLLVCTLVEVASYLQLGHLDKFFIIAVIVVTATSFASTVFFLAGIALIKDD